MTLSDEQKSHIRLTLRHFRQSQHYEPVDTLCDKWRIFANLRPGIPDIIDWRIMPATGKSEDVPLFQGSVALEDLLG